MTIFYEIEDIARFTRVQQFASYARLVKGQKSSAGKHLGSQGGKMGNAHLAMYHRLNGLVLKLPCCF